MRIFVDENIPLMTVEALRAMGHDVRDIRGTPSEGLRDDVLWEVAQREERLLITTDKGFAHYRMGPHHAGAGTVYRNGMARLACGHARRGTEYLAGAGNAGEPDIARGRKTKHALIGLWVWMFKAGSPALGERSRQQPREGPPIPTFSLQ